MAITLNSILQFAGNDRVLLNAQGTGLQSVNRMQRFKSFFNIGNARQKNAETLTAIHFAVLNDPRFAAKDLQLEAVRLLEEVRVDRALSAAQIKSIAQALDRLGSGTDAIMDERVKKCMAHVDMPPELAKYAKDVCTIAQTHVVAAAHAPGANAGSLDVERLVRETVAACQDAILSIRGKYGPAERELEQMVGKNLSMFVLNGAGNLRPQSEIADRVKKSCDFYHHAEAYANQRFRSAGPQSPEQVEADGKAYGAFMKATLDFVSTVGCPVTPEDFDHLMEFLDPLPVYELARLNGRSSPDEIFEAIHNYATFLHERQPQEADGSPLHIFIDGPDAGSAFGRFCAQIAALRMPESARPSFFEALESPAGERALARIDHDAGLNFSACNDIGSIRLFIECQESAVGRDGWCIAKFNNQPMRRRGLPPALDLTGFSTVARTAYEPESSFTGRATDRLRDVLLKPLSDALQLNSRKDAIGAFRRQIGHGAQTVLDGVFADTMRSLATGARVLAPAANVTLPGGDALEADPAAARDRLARLATGRDDAVYANLAPADRARANVLLALLSSDVGEIAEKGISSALSADGSHEQFRADGGGIESRFAITGSAAEGFHVRCAFHRAPQSLTLVPGNPSSPRTIAAGDGSFVDTQLDLFLTPADMDRLAGRDWSAYDPVAFNTAFMGETVSVSALDGQVQEEFRLGGRMVAALQINLNPAAAGT